MNKCVKVSLSENERIIKLLVYISVPLQDSVTLSSRINDSNISAAWQANLYADFSITPNLTEVSHFLVIENELKLVIATHQTYLSPLLYQHLFLYKSTLHIITYGFASSSWYFTTIYCIYCDLAKTFWGTRVKIHEKFVLDYISFE